MTQVSSRAVALQRTNTFVGRTMNWLYDHLRFVPRYTPVILCEELENRDEFPELEALATRRNTITRRLWHRMAGDRLYPSDSQNVRSRSPLLLHSHFGYVAVHDRPLIQSLKIPWFIGFYGADVYALGRLPKWQEQYSRLFEEATCLLALGPAMAEHLGRLGCPLNKVIVHPLGVDVRGLPNVPRILKRGKPLRVLFAGTFREKKGIRYVVEGAALAQREGVNLELILVGDASGKPGDAEAKAEVLHLVDRLGLSEQVVYHPFLSFQDLLSVALSSHVFLAPSVTADDGDAEGTPFVLQQMMATAMPCIATVHTDIPYLFGRHRDLLVPERDAKAIGNSLTDYALNPDKLVTDGTMLREQICGAFDVRHCAVRLSEVYDSVVAEH